MPDAKRMGFVARRFLLTRHQWLAYDSPRPLRALFIAAAERFGNRTTEQFNVIEKTGQKDRRTFRRKPLESASGMFCLRRACGGRAERIVACTAEAAEHLHRDAAKLRNAPLSSLPAPLARLIQQTARSGKAILNREIPLGGATALRESILPVKTREHRLFQLHERGTIQVTDVLPESRTIRI